MKKILAIGNSFSENATHYLHQIAEAARESVRVVNLYIGGCSLQTHWENIQQNKKAYRYELNGFYQDDAHLVSIEEVLLEENWDMIVLQQASHESGIIQTYYPSFPNILTYLKEKSSDSSFYLHQTWAYEIDTEHSGFESYQNSQSIMYEDLTRCYQQIANEFNLPIIPTGKVIQNLRQVVPFTYQDGGISLCDTDGYHLSLTYGRYAAALVWAQTLLGIPVDELDYTPESRFAPNATINKDYLRIIQQAVKDVE